jgi:hypothetical protein
MSSARELLEQAAPSEVRAPLPAAEVRRLGDRRRRRGNAVGALVAVAAVSAAAVVGVHVLDGAAPAPSAPVTQPTPTPAPSRPDGQQPVRALEGTRWIPDLVLFSATTSQAYPDETGDRPRALLTFEADGSLVLDVMLTGRAPVSVRGSWTVTADAGSSAALTPSLRARVGLDLTAPDGAPQAVASLVARLDLVTTAEGYLPEGAPPSIEPMTLILYGPNHTTVYGVIDLVKKDVVLPSPYPSRP